MPVQYHIDRLLERLISGGASELRLAPDQPPQYYVDGTMKPGAGRALTQAEFETLIRSLTPEAEREKLTANGQVGFSFDFGACGSFYVRIVQRDDRREMVIRPHT